MPVPDFDATVRALYRAATGDAPWDAALAALRDGLGAQALVLQAGPLQPAVLPAAAPHTIELRARLGDGQAMAVRITWPACRQPDATTVSWLDRLPPHLLYALRVGERLRQLPACGQLGQLLLDTLPHPAWLLQADGRIAWANAVARRPDASARWLRAAAPGLALRDPADQQAFDAARAQALASAVCQRVLAPLAGGLCAPAHPDAPVPPAMQARWLLRRLDAPAAEPVLLAILFDPGAADADAPTLSATALASTFGFTPAESRVAVCLAQGCTVREIAALLGVAPSTVRSHLDQVMAKLGVGRKLDAVRLLVQGGWLWRDVQAEGVVDA